MKRLSVVLCVVSFVTFAGAPEPTSAPKAKTGTVLRGTGSTSSATLGTGGTGDLGTSPGTSGSGTASLGTRGRGSTKTPKTPSSK